MKMNEFESVIDFGTENLRLCVFNSSSENIYYSHIKNNEISKKNTTELSLNRLIRSAEKHLSKHIDYVNVLYDSSEFKFIEFSIKKSFDQPTLIKKYYESLIAEANFIINENYFNYQVSHLVINNIIIDEKIKLETISDKTKSKSLILEIKFICLSKSIIKNISNIFKKNNLNISKIFCSSYVKTIFYKKNLELKNNFIFLDIGFERSSAWFFENNKFKFFNSISLGGNSITKDISKVLNLSIDYSEDLKKILNTDENKKFNNNSSIESNFHNKILKNNISIDILKKIIEARVDEIIELAVNKDNYLKEISISEKPSIIFIGSGSKLLSDSLNFDMRKIFSKLIFLQENDIMICKAGFIYNQSDESRLTLAKDKSKRVGFFETFFNFFSK